MYSCYNVRPDRTYFVQPWNTCKMMLAIHVVIIFCKEWWPLTFKSQNLNSELWCLTYLLRVGESNFSDGKIKFTF